MTKHYNRLHNTSIKHSRENKEISEYFFHNYSHIREYLKIDSYKDNSNSEDALIYTYLSATYKPMRDGENIKQFIKRLYYSYLKAIQQENDEYLFATNYDECHLNNAQYAND